MSFHKDKKKLAILKKDVTMRNLNTDCDYIAQQFFL